MAKTPGVSNEARAKVLLRLDQHPNGIVLTKLAQELGWKKSEAKRVLDDLESSGMAFADDVSSWSFARQKKLGRIKPAPLFEISPKGVAFLKHWRILDKLSSIKEGYSKYHLEIEGPLKRFLPKSVLKDYEHWEG